MKYECYRIYDDTIYEETRVMIVTGTRNNTLANIVIDKLRDMCKPDEIEIDTALFEEFAVSEFGGNSLYNVDFDEFIRVVSQPCLNGRWFCSISYSTLTSKQVEKLMEYAKNPSVYGILVVRVNEYKNIKRFTGNSICKNSRYCNIIDVSFPNRDTLNKLATNMFARQKVKVSKKALDLFLLKVGNNCDSFQSIIDEIGLNRRNSLIEYDDMVQELQGVDNYMLDDFIVRLTEPIMNTKICHRKIYDIQRALVKEMGIKNLVISLKKRLDTIIEMREHINCGDIPINVTYSVEEAKSRIGEDSKLKNLSTYSFKKLATIASRTSIKDWIFMRLILERVSGQSSELQCNYAVYLVVNRATLSRERLLNAIGISNNVDQKIVSLNMR